MEFNLRNIIKALLFSTSEAVGVRDVQNVVSRFHEEVVDSEEEGGGGVPPMVTASQVREGFQEIVEGLEKDEDVCRIVEGPDGYALVVVPEYATWVRLLRNENRPMKLSAAAMETLAMVAYRQPVTRAEMESVRGVSVDSVLNKLLDHELVYVSGQADMPGRPRLYATTEKFLKHCGINSLEELPTSDVLPQQRIQDWLARGGGVCDSLSDEDVGLSAESETQEMLI